MSDDGPDASGNWHSTLVRAAEIRHNYAVRNNKRNQNVWRACVNELKKSRAAIKVVKSGPNKGEVRGLPSAIPNTIVQTLLKVVHGFEPVVPSFMEGVAPSSLS